VSERWVVIVDRAREIILALDARKSPATNFGIQLAGLTIVTFGIKTVQDVVTGRTSLAREIDQVFFCI
jgi:hypothetical protein